MRGEGGRRVSAPAKGQMGIKCRVKRRVKDKGFKEEKGKGDIGSRHFLETRVGVTTGGIGNTTTRIQERLQDSLLGMRKTTRM